MRIEDGKLRNERVHFRFRSGRGNRTPRPEDIVLSISLQSMLAVSLHLALLFVVFFSPTYALFFPDGFDSSFFKLITALSTLAALLAASAATRFLESKRGLHLCRILAATASLFFLLPVITTVIGAFWDLPPQIHFGALALSGAITGIGFGCLMLTTSWNLRSLQWEECTFLSISATGTAAIILLLMSSLVPIAFIVCGALLPTVACLCSKVEPERKTAAAAAETIEAPGELEKTGSALSSSEPKQKEMPSRRRERYFFKRNAVAFAYSACAGFFAGSISFFLEYQWFVTLLVGLGSVALAAMLLFLYVRTRKNLGLVYNRIFFPCAALALLLLLFLPPAGQAVDLALLFLLTLPGDIFDTASKGLATTDKHDIRDAALARGLSVFATVLGLAVAIFLHLISDNSDMEVLSVIVLVLLLVLAMSVSMLMPDENKEFEAFLHRESEEQAESAPNSATPEEPRLSQEAVLDILAQRYRLTAREKEVVNFLAHGRNAAYIENKLVLSKSTVKSHMRHIYQKLGVHSQQQLIDLVEKFSETA